MRKQLLARLDLTEDLLQPLVERTLAGDRQAWGELWCLMAPTIERIAGRFRVTGRLSGCEDDRRNVVVRVMERLHADGFHRLRALHEVLLRRDGTFRTWIAILAKNSGISYMREHPEHVRDHAPEASSGWVDLVPLPEMLEDLLPISIRAIKTIEAHRIEAYVEHNLEPHERDALHLWLLGHDDVEIAEALRLADADAADHLVRAIVKRLRRRFAGEGDDPQKSTGPRPRSARTGVLYR